MKGPRSAPIPNLLIFDSLKIDWGSHLQESTLTIHGTGEESVLHMNVLKLRALLAHCSMFQDKLVGHHFMLVSFGAEIWLARRSMESHYP